MGGGLAGLACAISAASRGVRVDVFEQASQAPATSAFVEIVPNMLRDLVTLGLGDDCVRAGFAYHGLDVMDRRGNVRLSMPTVRLAGARYPSAVGIELHQLLRILDTGARAHGVRLHRGCAVTGMSSRGDTTAIHLGSGDDVATDLVVLAAGADSPLRKLWLPHVVGRCNRADIEQVWWYTTVQRPLALQRATVFVGGSGRKVMMVPVRGDVAGLALIEPAGQTSDAVLSRPAEHLRKALQDFPPQVQLVARQLHDGANIARRPVRSGLLPHPWHHGRAIVVGEAAHAIPPHLGQASAQALEDATVLSDLLLASRDGHDLAQRFSARRVPRASAVHEIVSTAARWDLEPVSATDLLDLSQRLTRLVAEPA